MQSHLFHSRHINYSVSFCSVTSGDILKYNLKKSIIKKMFFDYFKFFTKPEFKNTYILQWMKFLSLTARRISEDSSQISKDQQLKLWTTQHDFIRNREQYVMIWNTSVLLL